MIALLVPGLIALFLISRGRIGSTFLYVYLPCLLALPEDYSVRLPHLPPLSAAALVLIPLGGVAVVRLIRSYSFVLMDLLVLLFTASLGLSEILHAPVTNDGIFFAISTFVSIFLAYVVGRTLIEPDLRLATVKMFVILLLLDGIPGLYEWRMGQNLYGIFGQKVLGITLVAQNVQMRNGHGRMGTLFTNSEGEGIALAMTFCLNAWLLYLRRIKAAVDLGKTLSALEKYHIPEMVLILCLFLTQARGPLMALGAGFLILQIPRFKSTKTMTVVVALLLAVGFRAATLYIDSYTDPSLMDPGNVTESQSSAAYRRVMNEVYPPVAEGGGWTGYGVGNIPILMGMKSIDNHYLLIHLAWGRLAYILFLLIAWNNIRVLLVRSWQTENAQDRAFVFSMLAAMAVLWITLLTVFMGGQLPQVSFLLVGWTQAMRPRQAQDVSYQPVGLSQPQKFSFRRVFN
jgi:hypothetical protein